MDQADDLLQRALLDAEACASVALKVGDLPLSEAVTVIFHGRRDLGTLQTYVTNGGRAAGSAVGASELLRVPCDLDLADASLARRGRGALRRAGARAARRDRRRRHRARRLGRPARRGDRRRRRDRALDRARRAPARAPPDARRADRAGAAHARRRRLRRAHARRGPPADGDRLRPAGPRPRLSAVRRPRALPRGLRAARRRARPPDWSPRLDHQEASVQRFLELNGDDFHRTG